MKEKPTTKRSSSYLAAGAGLLITLAVVRYPEDAFEASVEGLQLWFEVVLPALLPFFTLSEILMGLGVIHAVGVLLEPLMRPLFRIPGVGGFAVAMGLASGYPLGAKISGRIRRDGLCTREEGERLVSFANTADPLFMSGAVAVGMFGLPSLGATLVAAHYLSVLVVGLLMRYHAGGAMGPGNLQPEGGLLRRAASSMLEARRRDARPFGELLRDAVRESIGSMLFIGGCIMMFSVLIRVLTVAGVLDALSFPLGAALSLLGFGPELLPAVLKGSVEITIGAQAASEAAAPLLQRAAVASAVVAWSGLSVHAQVAAMLHGTDVRLSPYLAARFLHAVLAGILTVLLFEPLGATQVAAAAAAPAATLSWQAFALWTAGAAGAFTGLFLAASLLVHAVSRIRVVIFRVRGA